MFLLNLMLLLLLYFLVLGNIELLLMVIEIFIIVLFYVFVKIFGLFLLFNSLSFLLLLLILLILKLLLLGTLLRVFKAEIIIDSFAILLLLLQHFAIIDAIINIIFIITIISVGLVLRPFLHIDFYDMALAVFDFNRFEFWFLFLLLDIKVNFSGFFFMVLTLFPVA